MKLKETETTEGAPVIKNSDEYWKKEFNRQRASRLQDSVDEYMQDGEVDAFFEDLRTAIQDLIDYHGKQKENAQTLMKVVSGHRPLQQEYNLREAEYYNKRAQIDAEYEKSKHYWDTERNKSDIKADGYSYKEIPERF